MVKHAELKERREANEFATYEFNRVKRAKLENERAKSASGSGRENKEEKQKDRERANRASAAASRAKIVCYSKELEKRTDRLELERNQERRRADRAVRKLSTLREEVRKLKKVLKGLWDMKDQRTMTFLVDSSAVFFLQDEVENEENESDEDDTDPMMVGPTNHQPLQVAAGSSVHNSHPILRNDGAASSMHVPASSPSALRNLIHPTPSELPGLRIATSPTLPNPHMRVSGSMPLFDINAGAPMSSQHIRLPHDEHMGCKLEKHEQR